jgi:hypothetical protein
MDGWKERDEYKRQKGMSGEGSEGKRRVRIGDHAIRRVESAEGRG